LGGIFLISPACACVRVCARMQGCEWQCACVCACACAHACAHARTHVCVLARRSARTHARVFEVQPPARAPPHTQHHPPARGSSSALSSPFLLCRHHCTRQPKAYLRFCWRAATPRPDADARGSPLPVRMRSSPVATTTRGTRAASCSCPCCAGPTRHISRSAIAG